MEVIEVEEAEVATEVIMTGIRTLVQLTLLRVALTHSIETTILLKVAILQRVVSVF